MKNLILPDTVVLADGAFPQHEIPLTILKSASRIICCDGSAGSLVSFGLEPLAIVGDCDSIDPEIIDRYADRIFRDDDQEINDLTKAVRWCYDSGFKDIVILGATGKREDHTLGNISLIAEYAQLINVRMITDTGIFYPALKSSRFDSCPGQQVSIFSIDPETEITSSGLKYPLEKRKLTNWWEATLNEAAGNSFELKFGRGKVIVFMEF
jgi:thiamine pyrophosphokinase